MVISDSSLQNKNRPGGLSGWSNGTGSRRDPGLRDGTGTGRDRFFGPVYQDGTKRDQFLRDFFGFFGDLVVFSLILGRI